MQKIFVLLILILVASISSAESTKSSDLEPFRKQSPYRFKIGDSFSCFSDKITSVGFGFGNTEEKDQMGEVTTYKDVPFGFSIISESIIKFSKGYPFSIFGEYFEANAGIDRQGHVKYTLGRSEGRIRRRAQDTYFLRVVMWSTTSTDILHASCEKL
jgi:hypothetical protein